MGPRNQGSRGVRAHRSGQGDSITYGAGPVTDATIAARAGAIPICLMDAKQVPAGWRVMNAGTAGDTIQSLVTQAQDVTNWSNIYTSTNISGRRVVSLQIGRNNLGEIGTGTDVSRLPTVQARYIDLLSNATYGYLVKGWDVIIAGNVGGAPQMIALRNWLASSAFLDAINAKTGQTYAGKVQYRDVPNATLADGYKPISVTSDVASAAGYTGYWTDGTHPSSTCTILFATRGTTPSTGLIYDMV
ncbi:MAG TPA: SGNH/GDSL hydrolase family protein [Paenirhodobacter sp.]